MQAAGLHFGHDAGATLVGDGGLERFLDKERRSRVKHALGLSTDDVLEVVGDAELVGLSSTQDVPIFFKDDLSLDITDAQSVIPSRFFKAIGEGHHYGRFVSWMGDLADWKALVVPERAFAWRSRLNEGFNTSYEALSMVGLQLPAMAEAMQRDGALTVGGRTYRARFYHHHFLHAQYAAYSVSPEEPALIITADGGVGPSFYGGGVYHWTPGRKLLPVTPIDGWLGAFYEEVAFRVGLGREGGAGKLMGLAPYGRPIYFEPKLVGTYHQVSDGYRWSMRELVARWIAREIPAWDRFSDQPPPLVADLAASAQLILEINIQKLAEAAVAAARRGGFEFESVVLAGGVALNCPANSNLAVTMPRPVRVPPAVNDEGLSLGAAVAAYFDVSGAYPKAPRDFAEAAYIGSCVTADEVAAAAQRLGWVRAGDVTEAVDALLADEAVGLCTGRSEVGPRALGHRSILTNAASTATWGAANRLKRREPWRPFAPAVLLERSAEFFDRGPTESRFMLFNYRCTTKALPAITHYDHSARVQHVSPETGLLYEVLKELERRGRPPVVLNTSFNGPGVPIVDTAEDAFTEADKLGMAYILTDLGLFRSPVRG